MGRSDADVWAAARREERFLITQDLDYRTFVSEVEMNAANVIPLSAPQKTFYGSSAKRAAPDPSPVYYGSGYIESADWWKLGALFGVVYFVVFLLITPGWITLAGR